MANIKSQKKRIITNEKARMRNRAVKSELKTASRRVREAVEAGNGAEAYAAVCAACRLMDKAVSKGVIKKNQAANRKSGLTKLANTVITDADRSAYEKPKAKEVAKGNNKAAKEARVAAMKEKEAEKAKRREAQMKLEEKANARKAKEAEEAAKAEAEAAAAEAEALDAETAEEAQADDEAAQPEE